ncbi:MAG: tyrosine-type recombinase/integrase [Muribaculaceae bacterium]|nr:tyrosine-type recombinase/integrase [Muribaculaceae bacterium]
MKTEWQPKNVKKMSCPTKRNTASELLGFTYPKLHTGKSWYVDFYATDPTSGEMRRKKYKLDGLKKISEKKRRAAEIIEAVTRQLRGGWNPWVNTQESRGFTLLSDVLSRYMEYIERKSRKKTKHSYQSRVNILNQYLSSCVLPIKYAYQFDGAFVNDYLDWLYLDRGVSERTRNNYRGWCYSFGEFLVSRKYIDSNPVDHIPALDEKKKHRKDLTPKMLKQMRAHLNREDKHFLLACYMEYFTFIRPTELSYLKVGDISIKDKTIFVSEDFSKNKKSAKVALNDTLLKLMIELGVLSAPSSYFLFGKHFKPSPDRCNADQYNRRWKKMREVLGWGDEYQFYSLKDSGIRDLANEQGVVVARDQARHSDVSTTNRYIQENSMLVHSEVKQFKGALEDDEQEASAS